MVPSVKIENRLPTLNLWFLSERMICIKIVVITIIIILNAFVFQTQNIKQYISHKKDHRAIER